MCGIAGFVDFTKWLTVETATDRIAAMTSCLRHRGPDQSGLWVDAEAGVALGHRRLSILDLSPAGNQPMVSASGRFVVVFNGEIYNFEELRQQLESPGGTTRAVFRGRSDTEVMLAAFDEWGVANAIPRFNGMFAFAVWDRADRTLTIALDRFGEKPLYYSCNTRFFILASELTALAAHPVFERTVDRNALALFLQHGYVPAPYSIYKHARKLLPGTTLCFGQGMPGPQFRTYWSAMERVESGLKQPFTGLPGEAAEELERLLTDAVRLRMTADVPVGAFLSGGMDSSLVVALMQRAATQPIKTFTIGFPGFARNEAPFARAVAERLQTDHTELEVTARQALDIIPDLPAIYDEPFADSSQIPTCLLSKLARRQVTVALSGDGADEIFGGYARYVWAERIRAYGFWAPQQFRRAFASALLGISPLVSSPMHRIRRLAEILSAADPAEAYVRLLSLWESPEGAVIDADELPVFGGLSCFGIPRLSYPGSMMLADTVTYLPGDILVKIDRASMGASLECRAAYLDYRVAEFAWSLPLRFKFRGNSGKPMLRSILHKYLPAVMFNRSKSGFTVPLEAWLKGPLRDWAETLLSDHRLRRDGFFHSAPIRARWSEFVTGQRNRCHSLWPVLMFQAWLDHERSEPTPHAGRLAGMRNMAVRQP